MDNERLDLSSQTPQPERAPRDPDVMWNTHLDSRYLLRLRRAGEYVASLHIIDPDNDFSELHASLFELTDEAAIGLNLKDVARAKKVGMQFLDDSLYVKDVDWHS